MARIRMELIVDNFDLENDFLIEVEKIKNEGWKLDDYTSNNIKNFEICCARLSKDINMSVNNLPNESKTVNRNEDTQEKCEHHVTHKGICVACGKGDDTDLLGE